MNTLIEIWKSINDYPPYKISNRGRVKRIPRKINCNRWGGHERILKLHKDKDGYLVIDLTYNKKVKTKKVHRLVAQAFIKNPLNKPQINHKKGIKTDNRASQLEWATASENGLHAFKLGLCPGNGLKKKVAQIRNKRIIKTYDSICDAAKAVSRSPSSLTECLHRVGGTCANFKWKFI